MILGENSRAISALTQLLQTAYVSWLYGKAGLARMNPRDLFAQTVTATAGSIPLN